MVFSLVNLGMFSKEHHDCTKSSAFAVKCWPMVHLGGDALLPDPCASRTKLPCAAGVTIRKVQEQSHSGFVAVFVLVLTAGKSKI